MLSSRDDTVDKLTSWNLTGSNDKNEWFYIDEKNTNDLVPDGASKNYEVLNCDDYCRYFRIMQTAPGSERNLWILTLSRVELFGRLISLYSCKLQNSLNVLQLLTFLYSIIIIHK